MENDVAQMLWVQTCQVTLLAAVVAVTTRAVARNRPHLAHALWLVVLLKCVTPPIWSLPSSFFSWTYAWRPAAMHLESLEQAVVPAPNQVFGRLSSALSDFSHQPEVHRRPQVELGSPYVGSRQGATTPVPRASDQNSRPPAWVLGWLVGVLGGVCVTGVRYARCWSKVCRMQVAVDPAVVASVRSLAVRFRIRRRVRVLATDAPVGPAVVGVLRPTVVLPSSLFSRCKSRELEMIVAHELAHIRRGDLWVCVLQILAQVLWWFHPLVWWANRWITREAERCCDEEAIALLQCPPAGYARALLEVLEAKQVMLPIPTFPGVRPLEVTTQRLERIMSLDQGCRKRTPWWCWPVMLVAACVSLPGAALVGRAQEQAPRQQSNSMKPTDAVLSTLREAPSTPAAENTDDRDESPMQRKLATKISVDFEETPLKDAVRQISERAGINLVLDSRGLVEAGMQEDVPVSLRLVDVPAGTVLEVLLEPLGLVYFIATPQSFAEMRDAKQQAWESNIIMISSRRRAQGQLIIATYPVADLVIPVPGRRMKSHKDGTWSLDALEEGIDFATLTDLLTATVAPDSWEQVGGNASVRGYEPTLSLVVRQSRLAHDEIRDILQQLRRIQNLQVAVEMQLLWPDEGFREHSDAGLRPELLSRLQDEESVVLSDGDARQMRELFLHARGRQQLPKPTFFNGQGWSIAVPEPGEAKAKPIHLQVGVVISSDRKFVRFHLELSGDSADKAATATGWVIPDGDMLVVDLGRVLQGPQAARSQNPAETVGRDTLPKRCLLLITPRVLAPQIERDKF